MSTKTKNRLNLRTRKPTPFIKWAGGKRRLLLDLKNHFPHQFNNYYEPFLGGGAVFFDLEHQNSFISDGNLELITTYLVIQNDVTKLIKLLKNHEKNHCKEYFYSLRACQFLKDPTEIAARFIYLNKTCYNGLYRVNKKNEFNTPFGKYKTPNIVDEDNLKLCHQYLNNVNLFNDSFPDRSPANIKYQDYKAIRPEKGDLVYFDPPYHEAFNAYNATVFDEAKQIELRLFCDELTDKKIQLIVSNSDTDFIRDQYKAYKIVEINAPRSLNSNIRSRQKVKELVIFNYEISEKSQ